MKMFFNHGIHRIHGTIVSLVLLFGVAVSAVAAEPGITVEARQRYPWNGLVDLKFIITGESGTKYDTSFTAKDMVGGTNIAMKTIRKSNGVAAEEKEKLLPGTYNWIWDAAADLPKDFKCERMTVMGSAEQSQGLYMVIDLSSGANSSKYPVSYLDAVPSGGWSDEYKTTKLVLRRIESGSFMMGSPSGESGRYSDETQHRVTLTKDFFIGVFEITQKQYALVTGKTPCSSTSYGKGDAFPVHYVSYNDLRGATNGAKWPTSNIVDSSSFVGRLRTKTGLLEFDLPTEAEWEYACRSGTTGMYAGTGQMLSMGWCKKNASGKAHVVGGKTSNQWGLFDMHGNVQEWTRDWYNSRVSTSAVTDPAPNSSYAQGCRVRRGGSWYDDADECRSADRNHDSIADALNSYPNHTSNALGFRISLTIQ